jgi:peptidoglycan hydrolase-like protein with peptidoglycan-binding domain
MKQYLAVLMLALFALTAINAQETKPAPAGEAGMEKPEKKRAPSFRANKAQLMKAQEILKKRGFYAGDIKEKLDDDIRAGLKKYQDAEGLKVTGTLNRATLDKMGIPLDMPNPDKDDAGDKEKKPRAPVFRANKEQIMKAQEILKQRGFYAGDIKEKLDDDIRAGLKKYQDAEGLKVTGTLNAATLEKMKIPLTDKQKETVEKQKAMMKPDSK